MGANMKKENKELPYLRNGRIITYVFAEPKDPELLQKYGIGTCEKDGNLFIVPKDAHKYLEWRGTDLI